MDKILQTRYVILENVSMQFDTESGPVKTLNDINLNIKEGEFVTFIGHSGCGKSTLLNIMAGFTKPTSGNVFCGGREVAGASPERAMVFQHHSLLPWLNCFENVHLAVEHAFGRENHVQQEERTLAALDRVGLSHALDKLPSELTISMKQRTGFARALALDPKLLLLDQPFSALDATTRAYLQDELLAMISRTGCTAAMVTHDIDEAILLSDKVIIMSAAPNASISKVVAIDLPRPRLRLKLADDKHYQTLRNEILTLLYQPQYLKQVA